MDWKLILQIAGVALGLLYLWLEYRADIRLWIVGLVMPLVHGALYCKAGLYADCSMQVYYVLAGLYGWLVWRNVPHKKARAARSAAAEQNARTVGSAESAAEHDSQPDRTTTAAEQPAAEHDGQPDRNTTAAEQAARTAGSAAAAGPTDQTARSAEPAAARIGHTPLRYAAGLIAVYAAAHAGIYFLLSRFTNSTVPFWDAMTTAASIVAMWMLSRKYVEQWLVWLAVDLITVGLYLYKGIPLTAGLYALYSALAVAGYLRWRREAALRS
ncbi:MAG: nicotinamide riboside transporter PnuC [Alistipes sp.]|uniref:nicotinamide riboside transporter PnuC n=1 Tax=Alistipes sp. TaxID=1872444 RepID=UPI0025C68B00|nr:nicotinamide riboside transporter PnuC [Alistipes sp.]MCD8273725.1 nicotinamide riboside transporter PnuC [Alistipes sp.]